MPPDLVIFDCDGVLVDSEILAIEIESQVLTEAGFALTTDEIAERFVGLSYGTMMDQIAEDFGRRVPDELNELMQQMTLDVFPKKLRPVDGIVEFLSGLELPRCLASSSDMDRLALSLDVTGLDVFFAPEHVFSAQMVEHGKPAPDLFLHAAAKLGTPPARCLVIEDSPHGVAAARAAEMPVIGFVGGQHARPSLADRLRAAGADHVVAHPDELLPFVA